MKIFVVKGDDGLILRWAKVASDYSYKDYYILIYNGDDRLNDLTKGNYLRQDGSLSSRHSEYYAEYYESEQQAIDFLTSWIDKQQHKKVADNIVNKPDKVFTAEDWFNGLPEKNKKADTVNRIVLAELAKHNAYQGAVMDAIINKNTVTQKLKQTSDRSDTESVAQRLGGEDTKYTIFRDSLSEYIGSIDNVFSGLLDHDLDEF